MHPSAAAPGRAERSGRTGACDIGSSAVKTRLVQLRFIRIGALVPAKCRTTHNRTAERRGQN